MEAHVRDLHHVRVLDGHRRAPLAQEAVVQILAPAQVGVHQLDGDALVEQRMDRLIDPAHGARAQQAHHAVDPQPRVRLQRDALRRGHAPLWYSKPTPPT